MAYQNRLEEIHEEFTSEAFNLSAMCPQDLLKMKKEQLAFVEGLLSFYSPIVANEEKRHRQHPRIISKNWR